MDAHETILSLIDDRIAKYMNESRFSRKFMAVVVRVIDIDRVEIRLAGYNTVHTYKNRTGETLVPGDRVYLEIIGNQMSAGLLVDKI